VNAAEDNSDYDYSQGLYNENMNGIWKGRGFFYEILNEKELADSVMYIEIDSSGIHIFDSQNENSRKLIKTFKLVNQLVICFN
jgi:hypothetical protein